MGYDLHITRAEDWTQNLSWQISSNEWLSIIQEDPELVPDPHNGEFAVIWKSAPRSEKGWFDWYQGNVFTTSPDRETVEKMLELANRLEAKVVGDNGELYTSAPDW